MHYTCGIIEIRLSKRRRIYVQCICNLKQFSMELLFDGKLNEYLHEIDEECYEMRDRLVEQMKEKQGVTEKLKAENQMMWVGKMNNLIACAEEIVVREAVYV